MVTNIQQQDFIDFDDEDEMDNFDNQQYRTVSY